MNFKSMTVRMTFWVAIVAIITSVGFRAQTYYSLHEALYGNIRIRIERRIASIDTNILPSIAHMSAAELTRKINDDYLTYDARSFIRIRRDDGTLLFVTEAPPDNIYDPSAIAMMHYRDPDREWIENVGNTRHVLIIGRKSMVNGVAYIVEMGEPTDRIDAVLKELVLSLLVGIPLVCLFAVTGSFVLVRRALQPVEDMRAIAEQINFNHPHQRLPVPSTHDPIENLSKTLNQMLGRLDQAYQQANRFASDASHEMRTPLAILRGEIECAASAPNLPPSLRGTLGSALEEIERLSRVMDGLIALARLDAGKAGVFSAIDIGALIEITVEEIKLLAEDKNILVKLAAEPRLMVNGNLDSLKRIIINLFDNAAKYTMDGGTITVAAVAKQDKIIVSFKDNGIGIPSAEVPHIFERFFRTENARAQSALGAGLGLSIVRSICEVHGAALSVESQEGSGTTVTIEFTRVA